MRESKSVQKSAKLVYLTFKVRGLQLGKGQGTREHLFVSVKKTTFLAIATSKSKRGQKCSFSIKKMISFKRHVGKTSEGNLSLYKVSRSILVSNIAI